MPINICIDVDLTLIDKEGRLLPGVQDALKSLRGAGFSLTLWSLGGVDYVKSVAREHRLENLFDGFAAKPDAIVDDDPDSIHPQLKFEMRPECTWTEMSARVVKELSLLDGKPDDRRDALALIEKCQADLRDLQQIDTQRETQEKVFHDTSAHFHPIPFFGHPFGAEILTMALSPSWTEFEPRRGWPNHLDAQSLLSRLFGYFYADPHSWFKPFDKAILYLERSYLRDAAHVDPIPYPTKWLSEMNGTARKRLGQILLEKSPDHQKALLNLCRRTKLVMIRDYPLSGVIDGIDSTFDLIIHCCPAIRQHVRNNGTAPPVLRLRADNGLSDVIYARRRELLDYLKRAETLDFA